MATIQKPVATDLIGPKRELIDRIRRETLDKIENFFGSLNIEFKDLLKFLKKPVIYPGKIIGLEQIIDKFLQDIVSKHYFEIQAEGLPIKIVLNRVRENLFQGGWDINRNLNIAMVTKGADARKAVSKNRIDEPLRLLPTKNKPYKAKSKPKPKKRGPKVKTIKKTKTKSPKICKEGAKINQCDYCGANARLIKIHINICQNPTHHHFCSDKCKISWIFGSNEINEKISQEE